MPSFIAETFDPTDDITLRIEAVCAPAIAAYKHNLDDLIDLDPQRLGLAARNPLNELDEEISALINRANFATLGKGVRAIFTSGGGVTPMISERLCDRCTGHGRLREPGQPAIPCPDCNGEGTVEAVVA